VDQKVGARHGLGSAAARAAAAALGDRLLLYGSAQAVSEATSVAQGGVYTLRDEAGTVVRTGRTSNLAARVTAHANDSLLGDFQFNVEYRTDVYAEQRGLEQVIYDRYPGAMQVNGGFNKIAAISSSNPNYSSYMQAARDYLGLGAP
jgi:hypothetical protein